MRIKNEDGYELWLRYRQVTESDLLTLYQDAIQAVMVLGNGNTAVLIKKELQRALPILLNQPLTLINDLTDVPTLIVGTTAQLSQLGVKIEKNTVAKLRDEGFIIQNHDAHIVIAGNGETAVLYGMFHFLRLLQTEQPINKLDILSKPRIQWRILAHWDNVDGSIERGYAGNSLWNWADLPDTVDQRYHDYARACASVGLNATCLNNVNAQADTLTTPYLHKIAALADLFRPYGIRVFLAPIFTAPMTLGGLPTADPRDTAVARWWQEKVNEIYTLIPDFGGFQVKANSEGQPGPQDDGANHDDGANMLARALKPHGGTLLWRAFVYDTAVDSDRAKCAYKEFVPLDGEFLSNTFIQVKNGPIDFQPREPFHPLFGAMEETPLALELQVTQEYLGHSQHLVYLAGMWEEILHADTYAQGKGSTVAKVADGTLFHHDQSCIIAVANTGSDTNWCGHHFAQANWFAYGRLAWDHTLNEEEIAEEWIRATWSNDPLIIETLKRMMLGSWQACIDYTTPLGLHHLTVEHIHYGPDPALSTADREDWNNTYFHRADSKGLGFKRGRYGSNAVSQYHSPLRELFGTLEKCPEKYLVWFHHVPWQFRLKSGHTLWEALQHRYDVGVAFVETMQNDWQTLAGKIDDQRHQHVAERLEEQLANAKLWRSVCVGYFGQFVGG